MIRWFVLLSLLAVVNGKLSMDRWIGKVAVVTGASSGIGKAIAEKLVEEGVKVVGVARRKDRLDELAQKLSTKQGKFFAFRGDLSKEEDIINAFKWTKQNVGPVSILINNAGVAPYGLLSNGSTEDWQNILNINVLAICIANREAIKQMKENNIDGHIININSVLGHAIKDVKILNIYSASKYAVTAITGTLQLELIDQGSKIKVTSISPGLVRTDMINNSLEKIPQEIRQEYASKLPYLETEDIADATLYVLSTPKHVKISELTIQNVEEKF